MESSNPENVLQYIVLCCRLILRYRLHDGGNASRLWRSIDRLTRILLVPRTSPPARPLFSELAAHQDGLADAAAALLGFVALLAWRETVSQEQSDHFAGDDALLAGHPLREALATLESASNAGTLELPEATLRYLGTGESVVRDALVGLRARPAPSRRMSQLKAAAARAGRGLVYDFQPQTADERALLSHADARRPPVAVAPWEAQCPRCWQPLSEQVRQRLVQRRIAQCGGLRCRIWLLPSEGT